MKFSISRDSLVRSLNLVAGVVERRVQVVAAQPEEEVHA